MIQVKNPGMYTTVQDLGRRDYQQYGMPVAGSMDHYAHRAANLLVGNDAAAALLEMTVMGGTFEFDADMVIAVTGANMNPVLGDGRSVGMWRTITVKKGDQLRFGAASQGCRTYLAVAGGLQVPKVLGSYATYVRGKIGGHHGRLLKKGDSLQAGPPQSELGALEGRFVPADLIPKYENEIELNVILGPQDDAFTRQGIADFFSGDYTVSAEFDRMGYRLEGKNVEHEDGADIISDGIVRGAVQIPGHGNPIIMLADCQTTGGYTKIAHVISSDLWKIAQAKAGDRIRFVSTGIEDAHKRYFEFEEKLERVKTSFASMRLKQDRDFKLSFKGKRFQVKVNEIESC